MLFRSGIFISRLLMDQILSLPDASSSTHASWGWSPCINSTTVPGRTEGPSALVLAMYYYFILEVDVVRAECVLMCVDMYHETVVSVSTPG